MAQVIEPTNDAGYMVANRIEPVLASPGASIYGLLNLAAVIDLWSRAVISWSMTPRMME